MKYELINPSDKIYFNGIFDDAVMGAAVVLLGEGHYALKRWSDDEIVVPFMAFHAGAGEKWFADHGTTLPDVVDNRGEEIADFLETLTYAHERSSMNNIGERAKRAALELRKRAKSEAPK